MLSDAYNTALRCLGPKHPIISSALRHYWVAVANNSTRQPDQSAREAEAAQLRQRAAEAGCDVSCVTGVKRVRELNVEEMAAIATNAILGIRL